MIARPGRRLTGRSAGSSDLPDGSAGAFRTTVVRVLVRKLSRPESRDYFVLLGTILFMVAFGLGMVLSSSDIVSREAGQSFFSVFVKQGGNALIGIPVMLLVSRIPRRFWMRWARLLLGGAAFLQILVVTTPLGMSVGGNRNWMRLGTFSFQPSELMKLALALWLGTFVSTRHDKMANWKRFLVPIALVLGPAIALVTAGGDLGTTLVLGGMLLCALFIAGTPLRPLLTASMIAMSLAILLAVTRPSRLIRILAFLHPESADPTGAGYQIQNGYYALAGGGITGVGLGNSASKWGWLPAADTDFIFAIIGNELGLIGAVVVLALFAVLTVVFLRIIRRSNDPFVRVVTSAILAWIVGEALINIAVVLGLFPVLGVPLPLFSSGGTALISTLAAVGIVLSFTRTTDSDRRPPSGSDTATSRPERAPLD